jgi:hypothetical protein
MNQPLVLKLDGWFSIFNQRRLYLRNRGHSSVRAYPVNTDTTRKFSRATALRGLTPVEAICGRRNLLSLPTFSLKICWHFGCL